MAPTTTTTTTTTTSTTTTPTTVVYDYDMIIIGGGSGGIAAAKRASQIYKKKVAIIESNRLGGTCVNVGCVPKKIMYNAASIYETVKYHAKQYKIKYNENETNNDTYNDNVNSKSKQEISNTNTAVQFDWTAFTIQRDEYIKKLNTIYWNGLTNANVTIYDGWGKFINEHTIEVTNTNSTDSNSNSNSNSSTRIITGNHIVIATGGKPYIPDNNNDDHTITTSTTTDRTNTNTNTNTSNTIIGAKQYSITSDEFFNTIQKQPKKVIVVGGGYIAIELASTLATLDIETHLILRYDTPLRTFDTEIASIIHTTLLYDTPNLHVHYNTMGIQEISKFNTGTNTTGTNTTIPLYNVTLVQSGNTNITTTPTVPVITNVDYVIVAVGRIPNIGKLGLENLQQNILNDNNEIQVNEYHTTIISNIHALGDVCNVGYELTPVAIAAGRRLGDNIFSTHSLLHGIAKILYDPIKIPTVVFTHPPIATVGLTEQHAIEQYGISNIKIYRSTFVNLYYSMFTNTSTSTTGTTVEPYNNKPKTFIKLIVTGTNELVIGLHMIGKNVDEILQGFAVAISTGLLTKYDFDNCIAIHPTAAEEIVTFHPWGLTPEQFNNNTTTSTSTNPSLQNSVVTNKNNNSNTSTSTSTSTSTGTTSKM